MSDLGVQAEAVETTGGQHDRVEAALAALAQPRVDVAAQRLDRERRLEREQLRAPATDAVPTRMPARSSLAPQSASRGSSRAGYAPTTSPSGSLEVMSFAEWTATSILPSSSASSSSLTNTPRDPISPNGFVRSRSPAVVIGTSAISIPGARSLSAACSAWVSASLLPREPTRMSTASPRGGPRLAASACPGRSWSAGSARTRSAPVAGVGGRSKIACSTAPLLLLEPKQMPHDVSIDHPIGCRGRLLHADRRQMQELREDLRRHRLDVLSLALGQPPTRPRQLAVPDLLGQRAQRRARHDVEKACHSRSGRPRRRRAAGARRLVRRPEASRRPLLRGRRRRRGSSPRVVHRRIESRGTARSTRRSGRPFGRAAPHRRRRAYDVIGGVSLRRRRPRARARRRSPKLDGLAPSRRASPRRAPVSGSRRRRPPPRAKPVRAVASLIFPAPSTRTRRPVRSSKTCCANAAAADGTDAGLSLIAVSRRTRRRACRACRKSLSRNGPGEPASKAVRTWPRISPSPERANRDRRRRGRDGARPTRLGGGRARPTGRRRGRRRARSAFRPRARRRGHP